MDLVGLIPIGGKPVTAGHWKLITLASSLCPGVLVLTSDQGGRGGKKREARVAGASMRVVWQKWLEPELPDHVVLSIVRNPLHTMHDCIAFFEQNGISAMVFGGTEDLERRFERSSLPDATNRMLDCKRLSLLSMSREDHEKSGTRMRELLASGDAAGFKDGLPSVSESAKDQIWEFLSAAARTDRRST